MTRRADEYADIARLSATRAADPQRSDEQREEAALISRTTAWIAYDYACLAVPLPLPSPMAALGLRVLATRCARRGECLPPGVVRVSL